MKKLIPIKDNDSLSRDMDSGAIISTNRKDYEAHLAKRVAAASAKQRVDSIKSDVDIIKEEINNFKADLSEIKNILLSLVKNDHSK